MTKRERDEENLKAYKAEAYDCINEINALRARLQQLNTIILKMRQPELNKKLFGDLIKKNDNGKSDGDPKQTPIDNTRDPAGDGQPDGSGDVEQAGESKE